MLTKTTMPVPSERVKTQKLTDCTLDNTRITIMCYITYIHCYRASQRLKVEFFPIPQTQERLFTKYRKKQERGETIDYVQFCSVRSICQLSGRKEYRRTSNSTLNMENYRFFIFLALARFALTDALLQSKNVGTAFIRFYNRSDSNEDISLKDINSLVSKLNLDELLVMYIHGHTESVETNSVKEIAEAFLKYTNVNIIALDYRKISRLPYVLSVLQCEALGKAVAEALEKLIDAGVNRKKIYVVGHSMGAQIAGYLGRNMKSKLPRITGLDPAGPLYYLINRHLSSSDAEFVDIIHTDAGFYGLALTTGSADFFPNFGHKEQPGCPLIKGLIKDGGFCDHHRSWRFYIESIKNRSAFIGVKCSSDLMYALGLCNLNEKAIMGYHASTSTKGSFYLQTNSQEPFGLGLEGAEYKRRQ